MENPTTTEDHQQTKPPRTRPERHILIIWLATLLLVLTVAVGLVVLMVRLVLHPKRLVFSVEDSSVQHFHISNDNHLKASFNFTLRSYNPNSRLSIYYDSIEFEVYYRNQTLAFGAVDHPFFQHRKHKVTRLNLTATTTATMFISLPSSVSGDLRNQKKVVEVDLKLNGRIRFKVGVWKSSHRTLTVVCPDVWIDFSEFKTFHQSNCDVKHF
ncbi:uncharacterized protein At1g08160-like [Humulus lupulus]|uniref:uncharacterized protein At1g08160-like n=1 Tax=Humulus lupulus TaxID=3486 RepID=UPI002B410303|nr:uncharacterized protein At1g08160-like [Humulus lupulus]